MRIQKLITLCMLSLALTVSAQTESKKWDLSSCIDYALTNNIEIQKTVLNKEQSEVNTKLAKAQLLPSLSGSIGQNLSTVFASSSSAYTGSAGLSASMKLFDGSKTLKTIEQQKLLEESASYSVAASENNIQIAILQSYMKILYASEAVKVYASTVDKSDFQYKRAVELKNAGSISSADLALLESQLSADKYLLVVAQNTLSTSKLELKQLLELAPGQDIELAIPTLSTTEVLKPLSSLQSVFETSLKVMPQVQSSKNSIKISDLELQKAKAGYLPSLSLNASTGSYYSTANTSTINNQFSDNFNAGIGLSLSIPIFTNRENKSAVEKAKISQKTVQLEMLETEKTLLKEVESVYQDALSAQSQYVAASEKVKANESSYNLVMQQFNLGMRNTLELLTEKNNLLAAQQNMMQAKYLSIMNIQILNVYQNLEVGI